MILSDGIWSRLQARLSPEPAVTLFGGVKIQSSNLFPYDTICTDCNGSGEGDEHTYCTKCGGCGGQRVIGVMETPRTMHGTVLITEKLPLKFAPSYPNAVPLRVLS